MPPVPRHPVNPLTPQHELRLLAEALDHLALARYESALTAAYRDITDPQPVDSIHNQEHQGL